MKRKIDSFGLVIFVSADVFFSLTAGVITLMYQQMVSDSDKTSILNSREEAVKKNGSRFIILSTAVGTLIEWYDLVLAIMLAPVLSQNLFPESEARFLETLAIVVTSYLIRPIGSLIFGSIGDAIGRKKPFLFSLLLMGGATFLIGCIPNYSAIGWFAPFLLLVCRLLQGLAISGEYTGATIFVAEHAPNHRRGFYTGFIQATVPLSLLLCLSVLLITRGLMTSENFELYGWRFPFLFSAVLVILSYTIRRKLSETPLYSQLKLEGRTSTTPVKESFKAKGNVRLMLLSIFGGCAAQSTLMQTTHFVVFFFLQRSVYLSLQDTLVIVGIATLVGCPFFQWFGALSDKVGRKTIVLSGLVLSLIMVPLVFYLMMNIGNPGGIKVTHAISGDAIIKITLLVCSLHLCCAMLYGPMGAFIAELFPTRIRFTSMGFAYNIGNGVLGGSTTFITELLRSVILAGAILSPIAGLIYPLSLIALAIIINWFFVPETYHRNM